MAYKAKIFFLKKLLGFVAAVGLLKIMAKNYLSASY